MADMTSKPKLYRLMDVGGGTMRMVSVENPAWHSVHDGEWVRWDEVQAAFETPAELALRNCLLLAMKRLHKGSNEIPDWEAVIRYCSEAGVMPSPLRSPEKVSGEPKR